MTSVTFERKKISPYLIGCSSSAHLKKVANISVHPLSWPLISSNIGNNYFQYTLNGITYNYTIPDGSYSATDLKTLPPKFDAL